MNGRQGLENGRLPVGTEGLTPMSSTNGNPYTDRSGKVLLTLRSRLAPTALIYDGYIHSYGPRSPGRLTAMLIMNVETQIPLELSEGEIVLFKFWTHSLLNSTANGCILFYPDSYKI